MPGIPIEPADRKRDQDTDRESSQQAADAGDDALGAGGLGEGGGRVRMREGGTVPGGVDLERSQPDLEPREGTVLVGRALEQLAALDPVDSVGDLRPLTGAALGEQHLRVLVERSCRLSLARATNQVELQRRGGETGHGEPVDQARRRDARRRAQQLDRLLRGGRVHEILGHPSIGELGVAGNQLELARVLVIDDRVVADREHVGGRVMSLLEAGQPERQGGDSESAQEHEPPALQDEPQRTAKGQVGLHVVPTVVDAIRRQRAGPA